LSILSVAVHGEVGTPKSRRGNKVSNPGAPGLSRITNRLPHQRSGSSGYRCRCWVTGGNLWRGRTLSTNRSGKPANAANLYVAQFGCRLHVNSAGRF
jgi:hypothetical protein